MLLLVFRSTKFALAEKKREKLRRKQKGRLIIETSPLGLGSNPSAPANSIN